MPDTPIQQIGDEYALKISEAFQQWAEEAQAAYPQIIPFDPTPLISAAMMAAGAAQLLELEELLEVKIKYDLISPEAIAWCKKYGAEQVKYVNASTKAAIRQITVRGLNEGLSPQAQRKAIKEIVGLLPQHVVAVQSYREGLLSSGMDSGSVDRIAGKYADKLLRYRAGTIGLTESHTATNEGARQVNSDAIKRGIIADGEYLQEWLSAGDKRRCDRCGGMQGKTAKIDGDFAGDGRGPPLHPNCRCTTILIKNPDYAAVARKVAPMGEEPRKVASFDTFVNERTVGRARLDQINSDINSIPKGTQKVPRTPEQKALLKSLIDEKSRLMFSDMQLAEKAYKDMLLAAKSEFPNIKFILEDADGFIDPRVLDRTLTTLLRVGKDFPDTIPDKVIFLTV